MQFLKITNCIMKLRHILQYYECVALVNFYFKSVSVNYLKKIISADNSVLCIVLVHLTRKIINF